MAVLNGGTETPFFENNFSTTWTNRENLPRLLLRSQAWVFILHSAKHIRIEHLSNECLTLLLSPEMHGVDNDDLDKRRNNGNVATRAITLA